MMMIIIIIIIIVLSGQTVKAINFQQGAGLTLSLIKITEYFCYTYFFFFLVTTVSCLKNKEMHARCYKIIKEHYNSIDQK